MPAVRPGFNFLICPDSLLLREHLETMVSAVTVGSNPWERHVYWGDEEPQPIFWDQLMLRGMFNTFRVVIVRQAHLWPVAVWKKISQALSRPLEHCWPFFCLEMKWEKGKPKVPVHITKLRGFDFADQCGWIWRHEGLTERNVAKYVRDRAKIMGINFETDALRQFCDSVSPDAFVIENELQKFVLLCGRTPVTASVVVTASLSLECNIFTCIRYMEEGRLPAVWKELARGADSDNLLFRLLVFLEREMRLLWRILAGEDVHMYPAEAGFKRNLAQRLGFSGVTEGLNVVMDAEYQVKSGQRTPEQSLSSLIIGLTDLFRDS